MPATIEWRCRDDECELRLLDQTLLPQRVEVRVCTSAEEVWEAIRCLCVRGAPAIGVAAAFGLCLGTKSARGASTGEFLREMHEVGEYLCSSRPTAVNLSWAVNRAVAAARKEAGDQSGRLWHVLCAEACAIAREDAETCRKIGENGVHLIRDRAGVLTHCNAGALATAGSGTALALMYEAKQRGVSFSVFADETRPLLQGARLTALELSAAGIDVTVLCDNMAASLMADGRIQLVVVGADRIAANGDVANKIGTYGAAVAARHHGIPFYVAAPLSTFDLSIADGAGIPIEQRAEDEIRVGPQGQAVPDSASCYNPAFDVTPAALITGIISERGLLEPVTAENIRKIFSTRG